MPEETQEFKVFISYARHDGEKIAQRLYEALRSRGFDVWFDRESMRSRGSPFPAELKMAIMDMDYVLYISTPGARQSEWVTQELEIAMNSCRAVIPVVYIGGLDILPPTLEMRHAIIFEGCDTKSSVFEASLSKLVEDNLRHPPTKLAERNFGEFSLPHYLDRPEVIQGIKKTFLADEGIDRQPRMYKDGKRIIGLYGMGGVGKTTLAIALARDCDVRRAFPDGIFYLEFGEFAEEDREVRLIQAQEQLHHQLTGENVKFKSIGDGSLSLKPRLQKRKCLLITDNVWQTDHVRGFCNLLGEHCRMIVTTRKQSILRELDALEYEITTLSDEAGLQLLAQVSQRLVDELPPEAREIVRLVGGLPLALQIIGSSLIDNDGSVWQKYLSALKKGEMSVIDGQQRGLQITFEIGVSDLKGIADAAFGALDERLLMMYPINRTVK